MLPTSAVLLELVLSCSFCKPCCACQAPVLKVTILHGNDAPVLPALTHLMAPTHKAKPLIGNIGCKAQGYTRPLRTFGILRVQMEIVTSEGRHGHLY